LEELHAGAPDDEEYFELYDQVLRQVGVLWGKIDPAQASDYYHKALDEARAFVARNPAASSARMQLADSLSNLAERAVIDGKMKEAAPFFEECAAMWQELFQRFPQMNETPYYLEKVANLFSSYSHFFQVQEAFEAAADWSEKALASYSALYKTDSDNLNTLFLYGGELNDAMLLETRLGRLASADVHHRDGLRVTRTLLARDPENLNSQLYLATALGYGGILRAIQGSEPEARSLLLEAEALMAPLAQDHPENEAYAGMSRLIRDQLSQLNELNERGPKTP
jgi:tetratricopeptide (TPR) repeat protein